MKEKIFEELWEKLIFKAKENHKKYFIFSGEVFFFEIGASKSLKQLNDWGLKEKDFNKFSDWFAKNRL